MFQGLSSLRKAEKKEPTQQNKALQDYLKRQYGSDGTAAADEPKRKKKKKAAKQQGATAIAIVDGDITGLPPVSEAAAKPDRGPAFREDAGDSGSEGDEPVIANPEEAEALRLQIEKSKNFYAQGTDGSGWVAAGADSTKRQQEQQRRQRHDSPDLSPPRKRAAAAAGGDISPPRRGRQRHDSPSGGSGEDLSPPRRGGRHDTPPHHTNGAAAAAAAGGRGRLPGRSRSRSPDLSPPRRGRQRHDSPDLSPPRKGAAAGAAAAGGDISPPRRGRQRHDSPDMSPPGRPAAARGKQRHDSPDLSPPRNQAAAAGGDMSPPRRGRQRHDSPDLSPPRNQAAAAAAGGAPPPRMTDGTAAGLVSSRELAEEAARLRAQAEERKRAAAGRGEATVYRDKQTGAIISAEEYAEQVAKSRRKREPPEEVHVAWKGGLAQQRAAVEAAQRAATEAGKAFGRSFDDDADAELKGRDRWGDPMAGKLNKKGGAGDGFDLPPPVITEANRAMMEASGFNVPQEVPPHSWLRRKVPAPVNRYNIRPGRHWDGVDRSNGFEKDMFKMLNQRAAQEMEARMWAQEDM